MPPDSLLATVGLAGSDYGILLLMKHLSLTTPRVIFLMGIPGAGKTYFARKFSQTFKAPFIELEAIRRELTDDPIYSRKEDEVVARLARLQMDELLKTNHTILYEGGLEVRAERQRLAEYVEKLGYKPLFIWIQTEFNTAEKRSLRGISGHSKEHIIPPERFDQLINRFTTPDKSEKPVVLSGKHTYTTQARTLLRSLAEQEKESRDRLSESSTKQRLIVPNRNTRGSSISL